MTSLVLESWLLLIYFDWIMRFSKFRQLHRIVRLKPVSGSSSIELISSQKLSRAIDYACVFYFKRVLCLQRSSATTFLFRRHGWNAEMVIGAQMLPFKSHAWCEINGVVVNDRPYMLDIYAVLERC
jgi:hypothetical protein